MRDPRDQHPDRNPNRRNRLMRDQVWLIVGVLLIIILVIVLLRLV